MKNQKKLKRRLTLLDDLIHLALSTPCRHDIVCDGPEAPIRRMKTCIRCAYLHKAIQMGLVKIEKDKKLAIMFGRFRQYSSINGEEVK